MQLVGNQWEQICFHIQELSQVPLVLGYPWLRRHNVQLDWVTDSPGVVNVLPSFLHKAHTKPAPSLWSGEFRQPTMT